MQAVAKKLNYKGMTLFALWIGVAFLALAVILSISHGSLVIDRFMRIVYLPLLLWVIRNIRVKVIVYDMLSFALAILFTSIAILAFMATLVP